MPAMREGDWMCPSCNNHNYASKAACNRCGVPKTSAMSDYGGFETMLGGNGGGGFGGMLGGNGGGDFSGQPPPPLPPNARPGDWMCPSCHNHNYASKTVCNKCGGPNTGGGGYDAAQTLNGGYGTAQTFNGGQNRSSPYGGAAGGNGGSQGGNWTCPSCNNVNFPMRTACNRCKLPKGQAGMGGMGMMGMGMASPAMPANMRPGDWMCPACNNHNYSSKTLCNKCGIPRETRIAREGLREGDWICRACGNHNYASKMECNKCKAPKGDTPSHTGGMVGGKAGGKGGQTAAGRPGDWMCMSCGNSNYAHRIQCNRCHLPKA